MTTAALLTVLQLHEHVETDLPAAALQRILDAEEGEIIARYGAHATRTTVLPGGGSWLVLDGEAASITSVTERIAQTDYVLAAEDYTLWPGGQVERSYLSYHQPALNWGTLVTVVYVPADRTAQRTLVLIQLCKLALEYHGVKAESIGGDYTMTAQEYNSERERLLRSLGPKRLVFA